MPLWREGRNRGVRDLENQQNFEGHCRLVGVVPGLVMRMMLLIAKAAKRSSRCAGRVIQRSFRTVGQRGCWWCSDPAGYWRGCCARSCFDAWQDADVVVTEAGAAVAAAGARTL